MEIMSQVLESGEFTTFNLIGTLNLFTNPLRGSMNKVNMPGKLLGETNKYKRFRKKGSK